MEFGREGIGGGEMLHGALIEEGVGATAGAIDELVGEHEGARRIIRGHAAHRRRGEDHAHAEAGESPDVRAVVDEVGGDRMVDAVSGEKGSAAPAELAKSHLGRSVGCFDAELLAVLRVEQGVEAGAPDDGDGDFAGEWGSHPPILPAFLFQRSRDTISIDLVVVATFRPLKSQQLPSRWGVDDSSGRLRSCGTIHA